VAAHLRVAQDFLRSHAASLPLFESEAVQLGLFLRDLLRAHNITVHAVSARAKSLDSVAAKLLAKQYKRPGRKMTDVIAARIILYHAAEVAEVANLLRSQIEIKERDSTDKRHALGLREFGYRSYHLVGRLPDKTCLQPQYAILRGQVFEVQVRSLLEHAWAEIEHGVVYKSGAALPEDQSRRFAAIAGVLELLEHEFQQLLAARSQLVDSALEELPSVSTRQAMDVPYMLAVLETIYPDGLSFRRASSTGSPFPPGIENRFRLALSANRINTVKAFQTALRSAKLKGLRRRYASAEGIPEREISHLAGLALLLASRSRRLLEVYFPEFQADVSVRTALGVP
jgi:ppGpp synthetase/RelA/SpoT-type nucleotidyltranferase